MSPRQKQSSVAKVSTTGQAPKRQTTSYSTKNNRQGSSSLSSPSFDSDMSYPNRARSNTVHSDDSFTWNAPYSGQLSAHEDPQFDAMPMDSLHSPSNPFMMSMLPGTICYNNSVHDQFSQGPMSQTLIGPLLDPAYQNVMVEDDLMHASPVSMDFPGYCPTSQYIWRHGQPSPPADIFDHDLSGFSPEPACDLSFQALPEAAVSGALPYNRMSSSLSRHGQPRPIRSASEKNNLVPTTMAPQDIHYSSRSDRADRVKARNDPRYAVAPDKDGLFHCPMLNEGSCNHKPTKQKCIYAKYLDSHLKPYVCTHGEQGSECDGARFSSNACLFRHEREAHGMHNHGLNPYLCIFPGCDRSRPTNGFPRRWNQRDHMKRVHDWEEPETTGYDSQDRHGPSESGKKRKTGHSHTVPMKRSSSSHTKAQAANYAHGSRHGTSTSRYSSHAGKHLQANLMTAYPMHFDDLQYSQVPSYSPQSQASDTYPNPYVTVF